MIPLLLVLIVLAVALCAFLSVEVFLLHTDLRHYRQAEIDELNALDEWANRYEHKHRGAA